MSDDTSKAPTVHIDSRGFLLRTRKQREIPQLCPFSHTLEHCGTWCPHFQIGDMEVTLTCSGMAVTLGPTDSFKDESE